MSTPLYAASTLELDRLNALAVRAGYSNLDAFANAYGWSMTVDAADAELQSQIDDAAADEGGAD